MIHNGFSRICKQISNACIVSVEKKDDGDYGEIRLAAVNAKYLYTLEHPTALGMPQDYFKEFIPGSLYEDYMPKDLGFEDVCYRSAVLGKPLHTYLHMNIFDSWFDVFVTPLDYREGNVYYCAYSARPTDFSDIDINSYQTGRTNDDVLKTCIKLHGTDDLKKTLSEIIGDIRIICGAEVCTIMLADETSENYSILAKSTDKNCTLKTVTQFTNFNDIAASWIKMIGKSHCYIIQTKSDFEYTKKVNYTWYLSLEEAGVKSVVLFPLRYSGDLLGFIWVTNFDTRNTMQIKETFELTTFFISSQLASYRMLERFRHISYCDLLTELPNRFACSDLLTELIRNNEKFTVVSIDINGFKSINDTLGFDTGNKVIVRIASRWKKIIDGELTDTNDYIARLSGDEFALVIRDYGSEEDVLNTIRKYESALGKRLTVEDCDLYISASFGYAEYPTDSDNRDSLFSYADAAMHEVKRENSSNHILRYVPGFMKIERSIDVENKIRNALDKDLIYFNLQPQFNMDHRLRGFEALARMKDENGKIISPGEFIPVAEKVGLIDKVDGTVFRKSASFLGSLLKDSDADITLSVNVSVRHMMKNDFLDEVRSILDNSGLSPNQLELEITESIMIDSAEKALKCIDVLKEWGIKIAIDDFGTGYSSLSYLNKFPGDLLKIDKSFVDKMNTGESSKQYVAAIISIGHIMNFEVIAEGVEENEQLDTLKSIGCDYIQGYLWGRPLPPEEAEKLVIERLSEK